MPQPATPTTTPWWRGCSASGRAGTRRSAPPPRCTRPRRRPTTKPTTNTTMPNLYEGPEFRRLLRQARRSLERTGGDLSGSVSLSQPDDNERKAIIGITGQYRPAHTDRIAVRLADLDRAVRESTGRGLPELLAELGGPLRDRPAERNVLAGARDDAIRAAQASSLFPACDWYREW